jgi:hypothetical protein
MKDYFPAFKILAMHQPNEFYLDSTFCVRRHPYEVPEDVSHNTPSRQMSREPISYKRITIKMLSPETGSMIVVHGRGDNHYECV